jgi:hypothetical protein
MTDLSRRHIATYVNTDELVLSAPDSDGDMEIQLTSLNEQERSVWVSNEQRLRMTEWLVRYTTDE